MLPDRWKEISALFDAALAQPPDQRERYLADACADDALREQVTALLECHDPAAQFMTAPAAEVLSAGVVGEPESLVGRQLGSYRLDSLLGAGGMGRVYKATDTRLDRTVAIKILSSPFWGDAQFQQRFEREARAIAALRHPHICVLHDIGRDGDVPYLVMEYLDGETLAARLERGPLPVDEVLRYASEIADALVEMHANRIIHRDLKPANIMLTKSGAHLLDFGLARLRQPIAEMSATPGADVSLPADHSADALAATSRAGTLSYMAPEQIRGEPVDHRTDLFAFGAILHELITGVRAFRGNDPESLAAAVLEQEPPAIPSSVVLPKGFEGLLRKCLRKDPAERWTDAKALASALRSSASWYEARARRRGVVRVAAALAVVAAITAGVASWFGGAPTTGPDSAERVNAAPSPALVVGNIRMLTGDDQLEISPALSPDGRGIAYSGGAVRQVQAMVRALDGTAVRPLGLEQMSQQHPRWSPDGTHILYLTFDGVFVVPAAGGPARLLVARVPVGDKRTLSAGRRSLTAAAWAPDGRRVVVVDNNDRSVSIVSVATGERRTIASSDVELHSCDWSPDGRWIACAAGNVQGHFAGLGWGFGNLAPSAIVVMSAAGGAIHPVTDFGAMNQSPAWSGDSRRLYFVSNRAGAFDIYAQDLSDEGRPAGQAVRVTTGLGAWSISFSADRRRLAYAATVARSNLWSLPIPAAGVVSLDNARPLTRGNQLIESMRVSRSGRWVLYDSNIAGSSDIYRVPVAGGQPEQLTTEPGDEFMADLTADDRLLVYHTFRSGSRDLFVKTIGGGPPVPITDFPGHEAMPAWSPDGRTIAYTDFTEERGVFRGAFVIRRDGSGRWGQPHGLRSGTWRLAWSPDGNWLATARDNVIEILSPTSGANRSVYTARPNSDDPKAQDIVYSDDGRTLYFKASDDDGRSQIWAVPAAGGTPTLLVAFGDRPSSRTDLGAGQGRFYFTLDERRSNIWLADVTESPRRP